MSAHEHRLPLFALFDIAPFQPDIIRAIAGFQNGVEIDGHLALPILMKAMDRDFAEIRERKILNDLSVRFQQRKPVPLIRSQISPK